MCFDAALNELEAYFTPQNNYTRNVDNPSTCRFTEIYRTYIPLERYLSYFFVMRYMHVCMRMDQRGHGHGQEEGTQCANISSMVLGKQNSVYRHLNTAIALVRVRMCNDCSHVVCKFVYACRNVHVHVLVLAYVFVHQYLQKCMALHLSECEHVCANMHEMLAATALTSTERIRKSAMLTRADCFCPQHAPTRSH
jgi:hypothetical protein